MMSILLTRKESPLNLIQSINLCQPAVLRPSLCPFIEVSLMLFELVVILTSKQFLEEISFFKAVGYKRILDEKTKQSQTKKPVTKCSFLHWEYQRRIHTTVLSFNCFCSQWNNLEGSQLP